MRKTKPLGNTSPWESPWDNPWADLAKSTRKAAKSFDLASEAAKSFDRAALKRNADAQRRQEEMEFKLSQLVRMTERMEREQRALREEQAAREAAELQEGIDYVMRSLGVTQ